MPFLFPKIRQISWVVKGILQRYKKIILASIVFGVIVFFLLGRYSHFLPQIKKTKRVGIVGFYTVDNLPDKIKRTISFGLTKIADDGTALPDAAKNWQVSSDHLVYTFELKGDLFWQDGERLAARDIYLNFKDIKIEYIDDKIIKFYFKEPYSPFPTTLSQPIFKKELVGLTPVKIKKIKKNQDKIEILKILSAEGDILYRFYPNLDEAKLAFQTGQIDIIKDVFQNPFEEEWNKKINVEESTDKGYYFGLFYNNNDSLLGSKLLRQALTYSISKPENADERVTGPISFESWAYNPEVKSYDYDALKAKSLFSKFLEEQKISSEDISLTIFTTQPFLPEADKIKKDWQANFNIQVKVQLINAFTPDYQIFLGIQSIPADPDQYALWHSTVGQSNITNFQNVKVDKLLEDGRRIYDPDKRKDKYFDFQKYLLEECPVAFISYPKILTIKRI